METKTAKIGGGGNSTILYDENTNEVTFAGTNVVTDSPGVGDILCHDENRKYRFIRLDTFHAGTFPTAWETLGVVVLRKGNQVTVCSKHTENKKFMEVYPYIVSGYQLDGSEHTAQLRLHGKPSTSTWYEFKYTASTDSEFVTQLRQFLETNGETDWSAYIMDGQVYLQYDNYTSPENSNYTKATGLILTAKVVLDYPEAVPSWYLKCGIRGNGIWHVARAKEYFQKDNNNTAYNPESDVQSLPSYPVCWPAFAGTSQYQKDHCLWLRQQYCKDPNYPKTAEWETYIESLTHIIPYSIGGHSAEVRDGKDLSDIVKEIKYMDADGVERPLYSEISYCSGFMDGAGYMPSMSEYIQAFGSVTYGLSGVTRDRADAINRSLYVIGGAGVSCDTRMAVSGRTEYNSVWVATSYGNVDNMSMYAYLPSIPFARLELPV